MNLLLIASSLFVIALSGALVPGPLFTITVSESVKRGFRAGPLIILGHAILELAIVFLLIFNITPFLSGGRARFIISLVGGMMLVLMGGAMIRGAAGTRLDLSAGGKPSGMHPVLSGIIGSASNPYWVIWWATIGLGYLVSSLKFGVPGVAAFFAGHIAADLGWYSIISFAVSKGRNVMGDRGYRFLLYACGVFLIFFGGWFISGA